MKITKGRKSFLVNSFEGSFFQKFKRALVNFGMSLFLDSFWEKVNKNKWEKETYYIFNSFLDKDHSYIDIGAWIGPTVLYGCQLSKHCYAIEPDPLAFQTLQSNINLNKQLLKKVTLYAGALSNNTGKTTLSARFALGDSMSSILEKNSINVLDVNCLTFEDFINLFKIKDCNFIKMDVEGAESIILPTMFKYLNKNKPTIHLSLHPALFANPEKDSDKIISILKIYKNVYSPNGKLINSDFVKNNLLRKKYFDIVLTDLDWNNKEI
jgi:FkbM family methyltransferase